MSFIEEQQIEVPYENSPEKTKPFIISKFPAIQGREIIAKYPLSALPKLGDYAVNEETMLKLMAFVKVVLPNGEPIALTNKTLVDNHVPSWEMLIYIEMKMIEYNCSFFRNGKVSNFLGDMTRKLPQWITKMLTASLAQLSQKTKQPSEN